MCNQLYRRSFKLVLAVSTWASVQASPHSSVDSSTYRSSVDSEVTVEPDASQLYTNEIKSLPLQFLFINFSKDERSGFNNEFCLEEIKFLSCKYLKKCPWDVVSS